MDEPELKALLTQVRADDFRAPEGTTPGELLGPMLDHLGSPDPVLRDRLIYTTLAYWIEIRAVLTVDELRPVLAVLLDDDHLGHDGEGDAVFTRSFSALTVPLLLIRHRAEPFLARDEVLRAKDELTRYLVAERDLRGLIPERGWAHGTAHAADALNELALCDELGRDDLVDLLTAVATRLATTGTAYTHSEDERLVEVVASVAERGLLEDTDWAAWFGTFTAMPDLGETEDYYRLVNVKAFLRTLHARGIGGDVPEVVVIGAATTLTTLTED